MNKRFKIILPVFLVSVIAAFLLSQNENRSFQPTQGQTSSSRFDFYVLALSWSPTFCVEQTDGDDEEQCGTGRPFAFVVHGLWPQNEKGFPADCPTRFDTRIDRQIADNMLDIMPSRGLVFHQWRKHGTCSGLSPDAYFEITRKAKERVIIPRQYERLAGYTTVTPIEIEQDFMEANPTLQQNAIAVTCSNRYLKEVRICMDKSLAFRSCPEVDRNYCRAAKTVMPPVRG